MPRPLLLLFPALLAAVPAESAITERRISGIEKRVSRVEKRVTALEKGGVPAVSTAAAAEPPRPRDPIAVYFVAKKQYVKGSKMGVTLTLEIENATLRKYYAFDCELIFRNEAGAEIWRYPYGYSEPLSAGERREVTLNVPSVQARPYLKFIKAAEVTVAVDKLAVYGD